MVFEPAQESHGEMSSLDPQRGAQPHSKCADEKQVVPPQLSVDLCLYEQDICAVFVQGEPRLLGKRGFWRKSSRPPPSGRAQSLRSTRFAALDDPVKLLHSSSDGASLLR